jgi:hypothetical protein
MSAFKETGRNVRFGGFGKRLIGDAAKESTPPRSGYDVTSGFAELDRLRAEHNDWNEKNPPRLERVARIVKFGKR